MKKAIHLFYGSEDFLVDQAIETLKKTAFPGGASPLNFESFDGASATIENIVSAALGSPLLGGDKMVVIRNFRPLLAPRKMKHEEEDEDAVREEEAAEAASSDMTQLAALLKGLSQGSTLIFSVYGNVDRRRKAFKLLDEFGVVTEFKSFAEWEQDKLLSWIVARANFEGKKIGSHAARTLMETCGGSLRALSKEIEKIATFIGERPSIEDADVRLLASSGKMSAFALTASLRRRDLKASLEALQKLIREKEAPPALLSLIFTQFRMMLQIKALAQKGVSEYEMAKRLNAKPYFVKKSAEGVDNFTSEELKGAIKLLHDSDIKLKRGYSPQMVLEILIIDICRKGPLNVRA